MAATDRTHWDERYAGLGPVPLDDIGLPQHFTAHDQLFPSSGHALELACGTGRTVAWLALRGMEVTALDVSPTAIALAQDLVRRAGVEHRCDLRVADLDDGLPTGPPVDVVVCNLFRDPRLYGAIVERLAPGGLLAIAVLSEVGAAPGRFRARPGELLDAFGALDVVDAGEADGSAWLLGRRP